MVKVILTDEDFESGYVPVAKLIVAIQKALLQHYELHPHPADGRRIVITDRYEMSGDFFSSKKKNRHSVERDSVGYVRSGILEHMLHPLNPADLAQSISPPMQADDLDDAWCDWWLTLEDLQQWGKRVRLFEFERSPADAEEQEVGAGGMGQVTKHQLKSRTYPLDAVIEQATNSALSPKDTSSVYGEMVRLAELKDKPAPLIGFCTEGIQYQGKKYQETGEPDIFTKKNLRDRMTRRAKTR